MNLPVIMSYAVWQEHLRRLEWLEGIVAQTLDRTNRLQRAQAGLYEIAPKPLQEKPPPEPMPEHVAALVNQYESAVIRQRLEMDIGSMRRKGVTWDAIARELQRHHMPEEA